MCSPPTTVARTGDRPDPETAGAQVVGNLEPPKVATKCDEGPLNTTPPQLDRPTAPLR
jgi:hypothetical protein